MKTKKIKQHTHKFQKLNEETLFCKCGFIKGMYGLKA